MEIAFGGVIAIPDLVGTPEEDVLDKLLDVEMTVLVKVYVEVGDPVGELDDGLLVSEVFWDWDDMGLFAVVVLVFGVVSPSFPDRPTSKEPEVGDF